MKTLVVYYSLTGKTRLVDEAIAKTLNAEIREIEEMRKRSIPLGFISGVFAAMRGKSSEIKAMDLKLGCDLIFLGTPVWGGPTPAINAFISKADFKDKKMVIFVTMGGFGDKRTIRILTDAIESRGGKIINSFAIKTGGVRDKKIIEKGEEIGRQYKN